MIKDGCNWWFLWDDKFYTQGFLSSLSTYNWYIKGHNWPWNFRISKIDHLAFRLKSQRRRWEKQQTKPASHVWLDGKWLYHYSNDRSIIIYQYASVISTCIPIVCFKTTMDFIDLTSKGQLRHPGCMQFSALEKKGSQHRGLFGTWFWCYLGCICSLGWWENLQETMLFPMKILRGSCIFSLQPIQWYVGNTTNIWR